MLGKMTQKLGTHLGLPLQGPGSPRPIIIESDNSVKTNKLDPLQNDLTTKYLFRPALLDSRAQHYWVMLDKRTQQVGIHLGPTLLGSRNQHHWVMLDRRTQHHWIVLDIMTQQLGTRMGPHH